MSINISVMKDPKPFAQSNVGNNQQILSLQPSVSYYIGKLLRANLPQLKSVVAPGAAVKADSFNDLNAVIDSLYLEPIEINYAVRELERLTLVHQKLVSQQAVYEKEITWYEEKIYWLLGYKYVPQLEASKILVVDDSIETLKLLSRTLTREGYKVLTTAESTRVSSVAHAFMPNLIMMDVNMPEMSGHEACKRLKFLEGLQNIPVIFMSATLDAECKKRSLAVGGLACITKPFKLKKILSGINQVLNDGYDQPCYSLAT